MGQDHYFGWLNLVLRDVALHQKHFRPDAISKGMRFRQVGKGVSLARRAGYFKSERLLLAVRL